ncbi:hypothetical protein OIU35_27445 [Boseaceae bacterium BT-24-1]|nr:hypothetical protein [Boseaceae bacterium BT-24-1]
MFPLLRWLKMAVFSFPEAAAAPIKRADIFSRAAAIDELLP